MRQTKIPRKERPLSQTSSSLIRLRNAAFLPHHDTEMIQPHVWKSGCLATILPASSSSSASSSKNPKQHSKSPPPLFSQPPPSHQSNKGGGKNSFQVVIRNRDKFPQRTHLMNPECLQRAIMWIAGLSMSTNIAT